MITAGDVALGYELAIASEYNAHRHQLSRLRTLGKHAFAIALRVAQGEPPYKLLAPGVVHQTLRSLELAGVVHHPESGTWKISDPLFRHYLLATAAETDSGTAAPTTESNVPTALDPAEEAGSVYPTDVAPDAGRLAVRTPEPSGAAASPGAALTKQVTALAGAFALATCALGILVHAQVWRRGTIGDFLGAFATCLVLVGLALRACRCQARAESIARRNGGLMCLGLWAYAGSLTELLKALARDLPGTVVTARPLDRREVELYRSIGFTIEQGQVATGRLAPHSDDPVQPHHPHLDAPAEIQAGAARLS